MDFPEEAKPERTPRLRTPPPPPAPDRAVRRGTEFRRQDTRDLDGTRFGERSFTRQKATFGPEGEVEETSERSRRLGSDPSRHPERVARPGASLDPCHMARSYLRYRIPELGPEPAPCRFRDTPRSGVADRRVASRHDARSNRMLTNAAGRASKRAAEGREIGTVPVLAVFHRSCVLDSRAKRGLSLFSDPSGRLSASC